MNTRVRVKDAKEVKNKHFFYLCDKSRIKYTVPCVGVILTKQMTLRFTIKAKLKL